MEELRAREYRGNYPSAGADLIRRGLANYPRQTLRDDIMWADGVDILWPLKDMTPVNFNNYKDQLLLLALQEAERYKDWTWKFAGFDVRLGRLGKGKDLPETVTFQAAMHREPLVMIYGEEELGYKVPQKYFLVNKAEDILDIVKRYMDRVSKQSPYKVTSMFISIREPRKA